MDRTEISDFLYSIFDSIKMFFSDIVWYFCYAVKFVIYAFRIFLLYPFAKCGNENAQIAIANIILGDFWREYEHEIINLKVLENWLFAMEKNNNPVGIKLLADFYRLQKNEIAYEYYIKAANLNYSAAQYAVFINYYRYSNLSSSCFEYLIKAVQNGVPNAEYQWALKLLEQNQTKQALYFMEKASKAKKKDWIKDIYCSSKDAKSWWKKFHNLDEIEQKAFAGDADSLLKYAVYFDQGCPGNDSLSKFHKWHTKAAKSGNIDAMTKEGLYIRYGWVQGTLEESFNYFVKAAAEGKKEAHFELGGCYLYGWGVEQNLEKAKYHYKLGGHKLRHITEDNIAELIDGKTQLEKIRSFYN